MVAPQSPTLWYAHMPAPRTTGRLEGATLRVFDGTGPAIDQPALDENVVALHLGGPKRVSRWQDGRHQTWDVPLHAVTLMPAHRANRWHTQGVIAFAHLTLGAGLLSRVMREEFDRDPRELLLLDRVGVADPLVAELMLALGREAAAPEAGRLYRDSLLAALVVSVLRRHATPHLAERRTVARGGLAGWQLRRVMEHMAENVTRDVGLDELLGITRLSRAQFFRAFRRSTGSTPARHMLELRMRHAGTLLLQGRSVADVATSLGYGSGRHFAAAFRRSSGESPSEWRRRALSVWPVRRPSGP